MKLFEKLTKLLQKGETDNAPSESQEGKSSVFDKTLTRRQALGAIGGGTFLGVGLLQSGCSGDTDSMGKSQLKWEEYFKGNFRLMSDEDKKQTIARLEKLYEMEHGSNVHISTTEARQGVLFGYAFNISKCKGYMDCVKACIEENNQDRDTDIQYIKIFESQKGKFTLENAQGTFTHEVPVEGNYYLGTQCFHCDNPPCTPVCPVGATWKEPDGIVVIDYDWCIGCRYCEAACPYFGRRFNWSEPKISESEINKEQHYLGNRLRKKGVMEKCTFCIQRSREGKNPACVDACPTGARVFGNLLDPDSEIRYVLENKKVFRLKEELGTEPKFWYYMD